MTGLQRVEDDGTGYFVLQTSDGGYTSRTIVLSAGIGAFEARQPRRNGGCHPGEQSDEGSSPSVFDDRRGDPSLRSG